MAGARHGRALFFYGMRSISLTESNHTLFYYVAGNQKYIFKSSSGSELHVISSQSPSTPDMTVSARNFTNVSKWAEYGNDFLLYAWAPASYMFTRPIQVTHGGAGGGGGALGPIRNRKTAQKIAENRKTAIIFVQNRKPK